MPGPRLWLKRSVWPPVECLEPPQVIDVFELLDHVFPLLIVADDEADPTLFLRFGRLQQLPDVAGEDAREMVERDPFLPACSTPTGR